MSHPEVKFYLPMDAQSGAHVCKYAYFEDITLALSVCVLSARKILYSSISAVISPTCGFSFFFDANINCLQLCVLRIQCVTLHYFIGLAKDLRYPCLIFLLCFLHYFIGLAGDVNWF